MQRGRVESTIEVFEIGVVATPQGGRIELSWQDTVYYVDFIVG